MRLELVRVTQGLKRTEGIMMVGEHAFYTLERPWLNNKPYISCIPAGQYKVERDHYGRHRYYKLLDVPNRSAIEIHPANYVKQLQGCIALGLGFEEKTGILLNSKKACDLFVDVVGDNSFTLDIINYTTKPE